MMSRQSMSASWRGGRLFTVEETFYIVVRIAERRPTK